ncbi:TetR family transcriptional regulator [Parafrankia soli]|uniref:TetR family transcriptional regulator n=1 Tax=Parafrankia soli TaxID=2599596 RepID=A0A1S1Q1C6_9ACTN|nr:TetR/AcrR family transcriptional regulator C-terminal domain-containing protein [Parafrankia soli]OHV27780.1 TetR family transcriptional regulator [Parafrankia soli]
MTAPDEDEDAPRSGASTPPQRTPRGTLSREVLLDAAMEIVRIGGADAFSMRALGARLEVDPTAVYRHFRTKNELLDVLADILIAGDEPLPSTGDARADLRASLHQLRRSLLRHPTMAGVILRRPPGGRAYWERANHALGLLRGMGLSPEQATSAYQTLLFYSLGHVLSEARTLAAAVARDRRPSAPTATFNPPAHQLPDLAAAVPFLRADTAAQFDDGLDLIMGSLPG